MFHWQSVIGSRLSVLSEKDILGLEIFIGSQKDLNLTKRRWSCQTISFLEIEFAYRILAKLFNKPSFYAEEKPSNHTSKYFLLPADMKKITFVPPNGPTACIDALYSGVFELPAPGLTPPPSSSWGVLFPLYIRLCQPGFKGCGKAGGGGVWFSHSQFWINGWYGHSAPLRWCINWWGKVNNKTGSIRVMGVFFFGIMLVVKKPWCCPSVAIDKTPILFRWDTQDTLWLCDNFLIMSFSLSIIIVLPPTHSCGMALNFGFNTNSL